MGELSYWVACYIWLEKCRRRWLVVASVSHNLCEILKVSQELEFKSGVHIDQRSRINGRGDEYKRTGELEKPEKRKPVYILWADSKKASMEDPAEVVCFEY